ncbi:MAG TPA: hypothetical protein VHN15_13220 [Thermoanaerobaculia bacterium]|nr:hypothetical protein [Thermoanaerobaculia bacterium]
MTERKLAKGLGWFSIGLGLTQVLAPEWLGRKTGIGERTGLMRLLGTREIATGMVILSQSRPTAGMWGRVAGDLMDLAVLSGAYNSFGTKRDRIVRTTAAVLGVTLADLACALKLQQEPQRLSHERVTQGRVRRELGGGIGGRVVYNSTASRAALPA